MLHGDIIVLKFRRQGNVKMEKVFRYRCRTFQNYFMTKNSQHLIKLK